MTYLVWLWCGVLQEYTLIKMRVLELKGKLAGLEGKQGMGSSTVCNEQHFIYLYLPRTPFASQHMPCLLFAGKGPVFLMAATLRWVGAGMGGCLCMMHPAPSLLRSCCDAFEHA